MTVKQKQGSNPINGASRFRKGGDGTELRLKLDLFLVTRYEIPYQGGYYD